MRAKLKGKKKLIILLAVMAAAVIAASAVYSSTRSAASDVSDAQSYEVDNGTISKEVTGSGKLEAADKTEVKVPAGIAVESVAVEAGDTVAEGDTLAVLDAESITDSLVKIESSLKSVKDTLNSGSSLTALQKEQLNNQKADLELFNRMKETALSHLEPQKVRNGNRYPPKDHMESLCILPWQHTHTYSWPQ